MRSHASTTGLIAPAYTVGTGPSTLRSARIYRERQVLISTENIIFWLILDPITFGLGSIGGYILFQEFVEHERLPNRDEWIPLFKQHWFAILALGIAIGYFFYRLYYVLNVG